jgi:hypothetical protein
MKSALPAFCLALLMFAVNSAHADTQEELMQAVTAYEVTLPKVEAYDAVLSDLVLWSKTNPKETKMFRDKKRRLTSLDQAARQLESVPGIKRILDKHQIDGKDMSLMPMALLTSRAVVVAEKQGMTVPAGQTNEASVAMVRANDARVEILLERISANLRILRGEK